MERHFSKAVVMTEITKLKECFVNNHDDFERGYHYSLTLLQERLDKYNQ